MKCTAIILAGGMGTRIRHILPGLPKPMAPIKGRPFLAWIIQFLAKQGLYDFVISTGYLAEKINAFTINNDFTNLDLRCVEEKLPLGTAGGALNAIKFLTVDVEYVLVTNGDSLVLTDLMPLFDALNDQSIGAAILGVNVLDAQRYGTLEVGDEDLLMGFREKRPGSGLINAGVYLFRKKVLMDLPNKIPMSFEMDVFPALLAENLAIKVVRCADPFIDIGTEESLLGASQFIETYATYFK